ncbi:DUF4352 domain-containing protein [Streptomyces sp. P17]|uniref:DUF4352 domain-containing protein n=1 Tax=Streptomyces sp. P17 TaxID=3074716 RepID=UPI0028F439AC|nr:DUF4352 domain-containing protein [Streptomyces sp. P17]MDT9694705.1 DUF4352 domain-containing protein [Streptomyces sp. P17]
MRRRTAPLFTSVLAGSALALAPVSSDGKVGDTLSLTGIEDAEKLDVTVTKVVDPARAENSIFKPDEGNHLVAVQFRMKNTGRVEYTDAPSFGAEVIDQKDQRFDASIIYATTAGAEFPGSVTIRPGAKAVGFLTFEVPDGSRVVAVQYTMNSGFSDDTGEWKVPKRR